MPGSGCPGRVRSARWRPRACDIGNGLCDRSLPALLAGGDGRRSGGLELGSGIGGHGLGGSGVRDVVVLGDLEFGLEGVGRDPGRGAGLRRRTGHSLALSGRGTVRPRRRPQTASGAGASTHRRAPDRCVARTPDGGSAAARGRKIDVITTRG